MRKQTKLVVVLSTAALPVISASVTPFVATGWAKEDDTWVYYNRGDERATGQWEKSGSNWYWLNSDGEMAIDELIQDDGNYYHIDISGAMATNRQVAVDSGGAGQDDEPDHCWYYFQASGKALENGDNARAALKTVNGEEYAFGDEGRMLFGWVDTDSTERTNNTDGDGFKEGDCYFGGEDDGAMIVGWLRMNITYDETASDYKASPVLNDDESQTRRSCFKSNGKKVRTEDGDTQKSKTINGKKYEFDQYGVMTVEWPLDVGIASTNGIRGDYSTATHSVSVKYAQQQRYFQGAENDARVNKGWFKVISAEYLDYGKYSDDEDAWYYADGSGNLYVGQFKAIKDKKYTFRNDGRMIDDLKFIQQDAQNNITDVRADDDDNYPFDTDDDFSKNSIYWSDLGYRCFYPSGGDDGAMRTNEINIDIDDSRFNFYSEKSGVHKGADLTGEKGDKFYQLDKLITAGKNEKYQVVKRSNKSSVSTVAGKYAYSELDDVRKLLDGISDKYTDNVINSTTVDRSRDLSVNKEAEDIREFYIIDTTQVNANGYFVVNIFGKVTGTRSKSKDGNDHYYVIKKSGQVAAICTENQLTLVGPN